MISAEVINLSQFQADFSYRYPEAVKLGTAEGVMKAGEELANDVSAHTPEKTGKAAAFVRNRPSGPMAAIVDYDPKNSFYMRFVQLGTKPHPIFPKGRVGSRMSKRISSTARRHAASVMWPWESALSHTEGFDAFTNRGNLRKAVVVGGHPYAHVNHPGIKRNPILVNRLAATQDKLSQTIRASIDIRIEAAARN